MKFEIEYGPLDEPPARVNTDTMQTTGDTAIAVARVLGMEIPPGWPIVFDCSTTLTDARAAGGKGAYVRVRRVG